jgi:hypothetical protein
MVYPKTLPIDAVSSLLNLAIQRKLDTKTLVAGIYQITGYVLGQTVGEPTVLVGTDPDVQALVDKYFPPETELIGLSKDWTLVLEGVLAIAAMLLAKLRK